MLVVGLYLAVGIFAAWYVWPIIDDDERHIIIPLVCGAWGIVVPALLIATVVIWCFDTIRRR